MPSASLLPRLALTLLLACIAFAAAAAERPPSDEQVERLLQASRAEASFNAILPQMETVQQQQFAQITEGKQLSAEQAAEVRQIQDRTTQVMRQALAWNEMKPVYVQVYKQTFSADDVKAMTKFYESEAGQSLLDKTPLLLQSLMGGIQQKMIPVLESLENDLKTVSAQQQAMPAPPVSPPQKRRATAKPASSGKAKKKSGTTKKKKTT